MRPYTIIWSTHEKRNYALGTSKRQERLHPRKCTMSSKNTIKIWTRNNIQFFNMMQEAPRLSMGYAEPVPRNMISIMLRLKLDSTHSCQHHLSLLYLYKIENKGDEQIERNYLRKLANWYSSHVYKTMTNSIWAFCKNVVFLTSLLSTPVVLRIALKKTPKQATKTAKKVWHNQHTLQIYILLVFVLTNFRLCHMWAIIVVLLSKKLLKTVRTLSWNSKIIDFD